jgi:hypothetical protein
MQEEPTSQRQHQTMQTHGKQQTEDGTGSSSGQTATIRCEDGGGMTACQQSKETTQEAMVTARLHWHSRCTRVHRLLRARQQLLMWQQLAAVAATTHLNLLKLIVLHNRVETLDLVLVIVAVVVRARVRVRVAVRHAELGVIVAAA